MNEIKLQELVGGALQEKFNKSFENVIENMQNPNTPYKNKRSITIKLTFSQNEARDDMQVGIDVVETLAPQSPLRTAFAIGKDLRDGKLYAEEYGKQIKGQMSIDDFEEPESHIVDGKEVDTETGEIKEQSNVVDFRNAL